MKNDTDNRTKDTSIAFALGVVETKLSEIARDLNESEQELRYWVGVLLFTQRQGIINSMSSLSGANSKMGKTLGKMEMDEQPYRKTRRTNTSREVGARGYPKIRKGYSYQGRHWTQLPANKARLAKMAKRGAATRAANKAA